jgi:hypothetical protein
LDHHTGHPAHHDALILLYECIFDALWIFSSLFQSAGSLLPIGRHSTSLRFGKTSNRSATKLICSFIFWTDVHAMRPVDSSMTLSWPF